jgi:alanyl-tRNA synthetase
VGCVAILKAQRWGEGKARIEFACGGRVVKLLREATEILAQAAESLKSAPADVATQAVRIAAEAQARRKQADALLVELARHEATQLRAKGDPVVARLDKGAAFARAVAQAISSEGGTALVAAIEDGRAHLIFARPRGAQGPAMGALLKQAMVTLGGKGGGGPDFAQGSGAPEKLEQALSQAAAQLRERT